MNCGSIRYFICHKKAKFRLDSKSIQKCKKLEKKLSYDKCFYTFKKKIQSLSKKLNLIIKNYIKKKKIVHIYGA